jgi:organic radical activating enzyme
MNKQRIFEIKDITDQVSPTFCLAKWHHTTIYLQSGETHSCYHPAPHKIPLMEIKYNPSAIHNTMEKKMQRLEMLNGEKPKGCQYCWNIEALGPDYVSDRYDRNANIYLPERLEEIQREGWDFNVNPEYIEVSFGNECNFKCGYCHPKASSAYYKEIKDFGPYPNVKNHGFGIDNLTIYEEETNPYVKAWWNWWPQARENLHILRMTGGEPLLQQSTWRLLDDIEKNPLPKLEININSNLGVKPILVERLTNKIKLLKQKKSFDSFKLFTSLDTWGPQAEYIRTGLNLEHWEQNFHTYLKGTYFPITFMITFNALSVVNFKSLLEKILEWRNQYLWYESLKEHRIRFDTPYLKEPLQYDMNILPKEEFMPYMYEALDFIKNNMQNGVGNKFTEMEYEKFRRVVTYMETTVYPEDKLIEGRKDFYNWFSEHDRRRGTNFVNTFPKMEKFFKDCEKLNG